MKKRSMLAIASLAAGFVVAAVTPSHALGGLPVDLNKAADALNTLDTSKDSPAPHDGKDTRKD